MPEKISAGLLMYKIENEELKLLIVHPGGPYFLGKDNGYWTIPKGEVRINEEIFEAAKREFFEETGILPPKEKEKYLELGTVRLKSGKTVHSWAFFNNFSREINCQTFFDLEWPPKSGNIRVFPEIDKGNFFSEENARKKLNPNQVLFIDRLLEKVQIKKVKNSQSSIGSFN